MPQPTIGAKTDSRRTISSNGNLVRCSNCGYRLGARSPKPGEIASCPLCGSSVAGAGLPSVGVEPLPPLQAPRKGWKSRLIEAAVVLLIVGVLAALLLPDVDAPSGEASRFVCQNNLKQIAAALHNYHDTYKALPAQCILDEEGRPMHSWRVALLPFLEQTKLYEAYDFDEPWDSPHNREVGRQPLDSFRCPRSNRDVNSNLTNYFVVYGDETMFAPNEWRRFSDVTDGLANTIMVVECDSPDFRVEWSEPRDIPFDKMSFRINPPGGVGVSSAHPGCAFVATGDGAVRTLAADSLDEATFRYLLIRNDGMPVQVP